MCFAPLRGGAGWPNRPDEGRPGTLSSSLQLTSALFSSLQLASAHFSSLQLTSARFSAWRVSPRWSSLP